MRRHVYSRFRPVRVYRDEESVITCTAFYSNNRLLAGSHDGDVKVFDIETTALVRSWQCHGTPPPLLSFSLRSFFRL